MSIFYIILFSITTHANLSPEDHVKGFIQFLNTVLNESNISSSAELKSDLNKYCDNSCLLYNDIVKGGSNHMKPKEYFNALNLLVDKRVSNNFKIVRLQSEYFQNGKVSVYTELSANINSVSSSYILEFTLTNSGRNYKITSSNLKSSWPKLKKKEEAPVVVENKPAAREKVEDREKPDASIENKTETKQNASGNSERLEEIRSIATELSDFYPNDLAYVVVERKFGLLDREGNLVTKLIYDWISKDDLEAGRNKITVKLKERYGIIDTKGKYIVKPKFTDAEVIDDEYYYATALDGVLSLYKYPETQVMTSIDGGLELFGKCVKKHGDDSGIYTLENKKLGDINTSGNLNELYEAENILIGCSGKKTFSIDPSSCKVIETLEGEPDWEYHRKRGNRFPQNHFSIEGNGLYKLENKKSKKLISHKWGEVSVLDEELPGILDVNSDEGFFSLYDLNTKTSLIEGLKYKLINRSWFVGQKYPSYLLVSNGKHFNYVLEQRKLISFKDFGEYKDDRWGYKIFKKNGKCGIVNNLGEVVIPFENYNIYTYKKKIIIKPSEYPVQNEYYFDTETGKAGKNVY